MNYIQLINDFWLRHEEHAFLPIDCMLYFHLLDISNRLSWKHTYKRNNSKIMADLGIKDRRTLKSSRNRLKQAGLIDFDKITTNPNVTYTLTCALNAQADAQVIAQASVQVTAQVDDTKDKLNYTKQNNKKTSKKEFDAVFDVDVSVFKQTFEDFRTQYRASGGTVRGLEVEYELLRSKHKDYQTIIPKLSGLFAKELKRRQSKVIRGEFIPELKNLRTLISQRGWEEWEESQKIANTPPQTPKIEVYAG